MPRTSAKTSVMFVFGILFAWYNTNVISKAKNYGHNEFHQSEFPSPNHFNTKRWWKQKEQSFGEGSRASVCLRLGWSTTHHSSVSVIMQTAHIMFLCIGSNWRRNIGRRFTVLLVHLAVVLSVAARSTTVWLINAILGALSASQKTNHYQERLTSENVGRSLFFFARKFGEIIIIAYFCTWNMHQEWHKAHQPAYSESLASVVKGCEWDCLIH